MKHGVGTIGWIDLTVDDAVGVKEFYESVIGWSSSGVSLGDYEDFCVHPPGNEQPLAGICHKRGENKRMPSQWMVYVTVEDLDASMTRCEELGGKVIVRDRDMGSHGRMAVIQDPAGAVCAIVQPGIDTSE